MARSAIGSKNIVSLALDPVVGSGQIFAGTAGTPGSVSVTPNSAVRVVNSGTAAMTVGSGTAIVTAAGTAAYTTVPPDTYQDVVIPPGEGALWYQGGGVLTVIRHAE